MEIGVTEVVLSDELVEPTPERLEQAAMQAGAITNPDSNLLLSARGAISMAERMQVILRFDEELKSRWVEAAQAAGQNLNSWLVAAANAAARVPSTRIHPAPEPSSPRMGVAEEEQRGHGDDATRRDHADPRDEDDARRHAALTTAAAQVREDRASTCEA